MSSGLIGRPVPGKKHLCLCRYCCKGSRYKKFIKEFAKKAERLYNKKIARKINE